MLDAKIYEQKPVRIPESIVVCFLFELALVARGMAT